MKIFIISIVIQLIIFIIIFCKKLDYVDRTSVLNSIHSKSNIQTKLKTCILFMKFPFQDEYLAHMTEGRAYNNYLMKSNPKLYNKMKSRMFWIYILQKHNIDQENVVAHCNETHCTKHIEIQDDKAYKEYDDLGSNVITITGNKIKLQPGSNKIWKEFSCTENITKYRIITLKNQLFCIWKIDSTNDTHKFTWKQNNENFEAFTNCSPQEYIEQFTLADKLLKVHQDELPEVFNIAWNIVTCNNETYVTEANVSPFPYFILKDKQILKDFKNKLQIFLQNNSN